MKKSLFNLLFVSILLLTNSLKIDNKEKIVIGILPIENISNKELNVVKNTIENYYKFETIILSEYNFPKNDSLFLNDTIWSRDCIDILEKYKKNVSYFDFIIGITPRPIKITVYDTVRVNRGLAENGVAIVSTYKIKIDAQNEKEYRRYLSKVSIHECGHLLGLGHCLENGKCFMIGFNNCNNCNEDVKFNINDAMKLYNTNNKLCQSCQEAIDKKIRILLSRKQWKK